MDYSKSFFPVILVVFLLRSFLVEPFKIPSGSMLPTLLIGDFILVNKYDYGIRLPMINKKIIQIRQPQRGDVMVFRYPEDPSLDYIKRVVGLPGDVVEYKDKADHQWQAGAHDPGSASSTTPPAASITFRATPGSEQLGKHKHIMMTVNRVSHRCCLSGAGRLPLSRQLHLQ